MMIFHIDGILMVHERENIVMKHVIYFDEVYGSNDPSTVTRRKNYECLGITFNFEAIPNNDVISQCDCVKKLCVSLLNGLKRPCRIMPSPSNLLKIKLHTDFFLKTKLINIMRSLLKIYGRDREEG